MAHFLPPEHVRQVNKLEWPNEKISANDGAPRLHHQDLDDQNNLC